MFATCKAEEPVNADKPVTEEMKKAVHEAPAHKKVEVIQQQLRMQKNCKLEAFYTCCAIIRIRTLLSKEPYM